MVKFRLVSGHFSKWERGENEQTKEIKPARKGRQQIDKKKQKNELSVDIWSRKKGKKIPQLFTTADSFISNYVNKT